MYLSICPSAFCEEKLTGSSWMVLYQMKTTDQDVKPHASAAATATEAPAPGVAPANPAPVNPAVAVLSILTAAASAIPAAPAAAPAAANKKDPPPSDPVMVGEKDLGNENRNAKAEARERRMKDSIASDQEYVRRELDRQRAAYAANQAAH
ncbi:hypothetical protein F503_02144 [Ophiostoma piceae UAMH 11346]|uniref:Uncharacterized protein n=1 Tax=Ophiostoma piceae (strain UAMH 11346) TaxID=1262450 RepID=S3CX41_OPHP1|nr:hypothetical protein F503_02144 [Ophiostoma piceae UAMH 11346]